MQRLLWKWRGKALTVLANHSYISPSKCEQKPGLYPIVRKKIYGIGNINKQTMRIYTAQNGFEADVMRSKIYGLVLFGTKK